MVQLNANQHFLRSALALAFAARAAYRDKPGDDAKFAAMSWDTVESFANEKTDTQGFVAANTDNVVVSVRGTEPGKIQDWLTDLRYPYYERRVGGGNVHDGTACAARICRHSLCSFATAQHCTDHINLH